MEVLRAQAERGKWGKERCKAEPCYVLLCCWRLLLSVLEMHWVLTGMFPCTLDLLRRFAKKKTTNKPLFEAITLHLLPVAPTCVRLCSWFPIWGVWGGSREPRWGVRKLWWNPACPSYITLISGLEDPWILLPIAHDRNGRLGASVERHKKRLWGGCE